MMEYQIKIQFALLKSRPKLIFIIIHQIKNLRKLKVILQYQVLFIENSLIQIIFSQSFKSMASSQVTYRTTYSKFNKSQMNQTGSGFLETTTSPQERNRISVIKKIIMISSIKKEVKKIFLKLMDHGIDSFTQQVLHKIQTVAKTILDNDKQKELSEDLQVLSSRQCDDFYSMMLKLIKTFVISPLQKSYILKIQKELKQDEELEHEIKQIQEDISEEKKKKLKVYEDEKYGKTVAHSTKINNSLKEAQNFENKLMRANQKLNELSSNNNKLRQKINQLRKQKNAMEDIYVKLKKELEKKKQNVENTIKMAGQAYCARNQAEQDLKHLKQQAEFKKQQFRQDCTKLNNEIQHDIRFKQFIKSKLIEKEQLQKLQEQIKQNQKQIEIKKEENSRIDNEYQKSIMKEMEIKQCFDRIRKQIGIGEVGVENQGKQLLNVFVGLYEKNAIMKRFVEEITKEVKEIEDKIEEKKQTIQKMYLKSSADECDHEKLNADLKKKFEYQERKKKILNDQYEKSVETIGMIKKYLEDIFEEINVDSEVTTKLKNSNINEENLTEFLGELEKKGLEAISSYGKLVSEQLRSEKGNTWEIEKQIDELNNIITLENVNSMNSQGLNVNTRMIDYPSELIIKVKEDKLKEEETEKPMTVQELKKYAIESLEHFQKKQTPKENKHLKKYNGVPIVSKLNKENNGSGNVLSVSANGNRRK